MPDLTVGKGSTVRLGAARPAFLAVGTAASNITGDSTDAAIVYGTEVQDDGGNYDYTTGIFTAPVDGWYHFDFSLLIQGIVSTNAQCQLGVLAATVARWQHIVHAYACSASGSLMLHGSVSVYLTAAQTVQVHLLCYGTGKGIGITAGHGTFSGFLIN